MKTEYLREFAVFSRYLSFTDAAKELFIAQSTLSTHIAALESDVGFSLIDRKAGNRLTDKGAVFLDGARTLLDGLDETLARCREMGDPDATLRIAVQYPTPLFATQLKEWLSSSTITEIPSSSPSSMARPTSCSITTTRLSPHS